jgi:NAD(P)H-hydrate epimerase
MNKVGKKEFKQLKFPGKKSRKGDAGHLLVISGFGEYHGALLYSLKTASHIVDIIYVYTSSENKKIINKLKQKTAEFVAVRDINKIIKKVETVLIGPGLGRGKTAYALTKKALKSGKKSVFDADAISIFDKKLLLLLSNKHILTPHKKEFERAFKLKPTKSNIKATSKKFKCTIVVKGPIDYIGSTQNRFGENHTGNVGMTKGGTGDVLAGLIAAFYCLTDEPYIAAAAGVFVNGLAGDELYKKVNRFYNAEDLVEQIPRTLANLVKSK